MSNAIDFLYGLFVLYAIPFVFALGLIMLLYGCLNYFVLGLGGDEDKSEEGRGQLLWAFLLFALGLIAYAFIYGLTWFLAEIQERAQDAGTGDSSGSVRIEEETRLQRVPDVPQRNN